MRNTFYSMLVWLIVAGIFLGATSARALAQNNVRTLNDELETDITDKGFKLVVCDGPDLRDLNQPIWVKVNGVMVQAGKTVGGNPEGYIPCDFNGIMLTVQHLLNIAVSAGVIIAILGFFFVGWLYIKGAEKDRTRAKDALWTLLKGFIIMLLAWFIVNQILKWLTDDSGITALLGS